MNRNQPLMTYLFFGINILVFLYMMLVYGTTEDSRALIEMGAKFNYSIIINNEWWRLLTAAFLHIGFNHILLNGISIYFMGLELEPAIGHWKFAIIYLISGIGGNLCSFAFNPVNISAGASTSIFGLFTTFIALSYLFPQSAVLKQRSSNFTVLILLNFINGLLLGGVDNFGHLGGAIYGFLTTIFLFSFDFKINKKETIASLLGLIGLTIVLVVLGYYNFNKAIGG